MKVKPRDGCIQIHAFLSTSACIAHAGHCWIPPVDGLLVVFGFKRRIGLMPRRASEPTTRAPADRQGSMRVALSLLLAVLLQCFSALAQVIVDENGGKRPLVRSPHIWRT